LSGHCWSARARARCASWRWPRARDRPSLAPPARR
jgi:hypothetical protein